MKKTAAPEAKLPASLSQYEPSKAIVRRFCEWIGAFPEDNTSCGLTDERRIELRFWVTLSIAFTAYCSGPDSETGKWMKQRVSPGRNRKDARARRPVGPAAGDPATVEGCPPHARRAFLAALTPMRRITSVMHPR